MLDSLARVGRQYKELKGIMNRKEGQRCRIACIRQPKINILQTT